MTTPTAAGPTTEERVRSMISDPDAVVGPVVAAVNSLVATWLAPDAAGDWRPEHVHGATMLAARLYRRKDSPAGVLPMGSEGVAYVRRTDPDVALLLGMGAYTPPRVG